MSDTKIIAHVPGWTSPEDWTDYDSQKSEAIYLEGGEVYYIKALMTEGSGSDHLAVAWQGPTITQAIIAGEYLRAPLDFNAPDNVTHINWIKTQENAGILSWQAAVDNVGIAHMRFTTTIRY